MTPVASWGQHQNRFGRRYRVLLDSARQLREQGHNEAAIVAAQTACEVCAEIVLTDAFGTRQLGHLAEPVMGLLNNYNLGNGKVRKVYEAVTGDDAIAQQPFWPKFQEHVRKRNDVVHSGEGADGADADASMAAVEGVIGHLQAHYWATRPGS